MDLFLPALYLLYTVLVLLKRFCPNTGEQTRTTVWRPE